MNLIVQVIKRIFVVFLLVQKNKSSFDERNSSFVSTTNYSRSNSKPLHEHKVQEQSKTRETERAKARPLDRTYEKTRGEETY